MSETITKLVSIAAVAVLLLSAALLLDNHSFTTKPVDSASDFPRVNLAAFVVKDNGDLQPVNGFQNPGSTLVFKVDTFEPVIVALTVSQAGEPPQLRFRTEVLSAGAEQLLLKDGQVFGYELKHREQSIKFCAIASESKNSLNRRLRLISRIWDSLPDSSCVSINTQ